MIVGSPAKHRAINVPEMSGGLPEGGNAAINLNAQRGEVVFQTIHIVVAQWWYCAVFPWTQALENGFTGVDDKAVAAGLGHGVDKIGYIFVAIQVINADAVLHGDWQCGGLAHGRDTTRH